jgi:hypothetical protein
MLIHFFRTHQRGAVPEAVSALNLAPLHEGVWGCGDIATRILQLSAWGRGVVTFTYQQFTPGTHWTEDWLGHRYSLDAAG